MYHNLLKAMKIKGVTILQIASLLKCRQATVSDKLHGVTKSGFTYDEAKLIGDVLLPEYNLDYLFDRNEEIA